MITLNISGMTCANCAQHVRAALLKVPGVQEADVEYPGGVVRACVTETLDPQALIDAVSDLGYTAKADSNVGGTAAVDNLAPGKTRAHGGGRLHIAILGSGSAAFAAAIRATEEGARVTMIEHGTLGGTCVNVGCVPSKIMIRGAHIAHEAQHHPFAGITKQGPVIDRRQMLAQQQARVDELHQAKHQSILDDNPGIALLSGHARFKTPNQLAVEGEDGDIEEIHADRVLVATGASPYVPPIPGLKDTPFWTSTEALVAEHIPDHLIVLGGSAVGLELGQAFRRLGARVTILELMDRLLPTEDEQLSHGLREALETEEIKIHTGFKSEKIAYLANCFNITGNDTTVTGSHLLVATGRRPNTADLGLEAIGVTTLKNGAIVVNERLETNVPGVYAAGDCTEHPQFVYVAAASGTRAAINMTGGSAAIDLSIVPAVVFTDPQVATVGLNERAAREKGLAVEVRTLTLDHVPRALANFDTRGFIKLLAEKGSGRLLGAQILAPEAGEIILTATLAIRHGMTVQELGEMLFPYLVMAEGLKLCAQTFTKDVAKLSCCAG